MKDDFIASVSHELRTPLTSIRGYLELVLEGEAGEITADQQEFLSIVDRNADRLLHVVGDLLSVAQVDAGKLRLEYGPVDLAEITSEAVEAARPRAAAAQIELHVEVADVVIDGDRARLAQVLDNLISNAIKFTPAAGRADIRVARDGDSATITVADTGMGISEEERKLLFQRVFRTSGATRAAIQGTGLGLTIVAAIVESHGGRIDVESHEGEGTTFLVTLPLAVHELAHS